LPPLAKPLLITNKVADFDNIAGDTIFEDFDSLHTRQSIVAIRCKSFRVRDGISQRTCCTGTLLASSLMRSRAFRMAAGSNVFRVVFTVMLPSTKSSTQAMPCLSKVFVIVGQASFRYTSRYLGKSVAKDDSSAKVPPTLSSCLNSSI
jgi:hypothetical protein